MWKQNWDPALAKASFPANYRQRRDIRRFRKSAIRDAKLEEN